MAEGGIYTSKQNRNLLKGFFNYFNSFECAWIPIGHAGSDSNQIGFLYMRDLVPKYFLGNTILAIFSWNALDRQGFLNFNLPEFTISIFLSFDGGIETINKSDLKTIVS